MINANELRIGNWVKFNHIHQFNDKVWKIDADGLYIDNTPEDQHPRLYMVNGYNVEMVYPIPLTPQILEKCGFKMEERSGSSTPTDAFRVYTLEPLTFNSNHGWWMNGKNIQNEAGCPKSLHQLQNLYFALTGTELEYKP